MKATHDDIALTTADHLVGNLWYNLEAVAVIASLVGPDEMTEVAPGPAATVYREMCRLLRSANEQLSAGALEAGLKAQGFDFQWSIDVQKRIESEDVKTLQSYAREIVNSVDLRRIQVACHKAAQAAIEPQADAAQVGGDLMKAITPADGKVVTVEHVSAATKRLLQRNEDIRQGTHNSGLRTGFVALDRNFRMRPGDLITLGGRPSQGKTSLARQIAMNVAADLVRNEIDGQVVFFSADDTADKVADGLACGLARIDSNALETNKLTDDEWRRLERAYADLDRLPLKIDSATDLTADGIYYRLAMLNAQTPVVFAAQDYLELIRAPKGSYDKLQQVEDNANEVKGIAKKMNIPFLLLSQLKKVVDERKSKMPEPADMKYAGEAQSDVMLLAMRPEHYLSRGEECDCKPGDEEGVAVIGIGKNKRGRVGQTRLAFVKQWSWFADLERRDLNDY